MADSFEEGYNLYSTAPDLMLIEVWHRVPTAYTKEDIYEFMRGYAAARAMRDAYVGDVSSPDL